MSINPELQRNFWLELTQSRLLVTLAIVIGLFYVGWLFDEEGATGLAQVAYWIFVVFSVVWGPRLGSESLTQELENHTWDGQRMSGLGPWSMVWGKLLGGTSFSWVIGLFALLVYMLAEPSRDVVIANTFVMILCALFAQSMALMLTLGVMAKGERNGRGNGSRLVGISQLVAIIIGLVLLSTLVAGNGPTDITREAVWWGMTFSKHGILMASTVAFFIWSLIANYRLMGQELQVISGPVAWVVFHAFVVVYLVGFLEPKNAFDAGLMDVDNARLLGAFVFSIALAYLAVFIEPKNRMSMRAGLHAIGERNLFRTWQNTPGWLVSAAVAIVFSILASQLLTDAPMMVVDEFLDTSLGSNTFPPAVMLFVLRDLALVVWVNLQAPAGSRSAQRADLTAMVYLLVLYWLLPALIGLSGNTALFILFVPGKGAEGLLPLLPPLLELILVLWLLRRAWVRNWQAVG